MTRAGFVWVIEWRVLPRGGWRIYTPAGERVPWAFTSRRLAEAALRRRKFLGVKRGGARIVRYVRERGAR
jgi:hypothetical protein